MSAFTPLVGGSDALWLHSFAGASANSIVHSEYCNCRCGLNNNGRGGAGRASTSPFTSSSTSPGPSSTRRSATLKRLFQSSLALLFLCSAFLIYLHSPSSASSAEESDASAGGRKTQLLVSEGARFVAAAASSIHDDFVGGAAAAAAPPAARSRRMIRALRSSSRRNEIETNEIQPQQPQQRQPSSVKDNSSPGLLRKLVNSPTTPRQPEENNNNANNLDPSSSSPSTPENQQQQQQQPPHQPQQQILPQTELKDILFTVKTTAKFHKTRLPVLLSTWVSFVRDNTYFFTDAEDADLAARLPPNRLVNTNCSASHNRKALCCKMAAEFDAFLKDLTKRWFCHVDDDTYVNVPEMLHLLRTFDHREDWYLGKPSLRHPIEIIDRDHMNHLSPAEERVVQMRQQQQQQQQQQTAGKNNNNNNVNNNNRATFWFATGGAGFCISRALATKMAPVAGEGRFKIVGDNIRMTDDITMGYIVEHVLKKKLTVVDRFHSHLESMRLIPPSQIESQVTLSYGSYGNEMNVLRLKGFSEREDPSRLRSLHCRLFPGSTTSTSVGVGEMTGSGGPWDNTLICPDRSSLILRR